MGMQWYICALWSYNDFNDRHHFRWWLGFWESFPMHLIIPDLFIYVYLFKMCISCWWTDIVQPENMEVRNAMLIQWSHHPLTPSHATYRVASLTKHQLQNLIDVFLHVNKIRWNIRFICKKHDWWVHHSSSICCGLCPLGWWTMGSRGASPSRHVVEEAFNLPSCGNTQKKTHRIFNWLVVLEHFLWDVILPIDFHIFQDG